MNSITTRVKRLSASAFAICSPFALFGFILPSEALAFSLTGNKISLEVNPNGSLGPIYYDAGDGIGPIEYVMPGTSVYNFSVGVNGFEDFAALSGPNTFGFTVADTSSDNNLSALLEGGIFRTLYGDLGITRTISFGADSSFVKITTTLTNSSTGVVPENITFMDSLDPNQGIGQGLGFETSNDIIADKLVLATAGVRTIGLGSMDAGVVPSAAGLFNTNPYDFLQDDLGSDPNGASDNTAINLTFEPVYLLPSQSITHRSFIVFGRTQAEAEATFIAAATDNVPDQSIPEPDVMTGLLTTVAIFGLGAFRKRR
jgi:hypothetical protein